MIQVPAGVADRAAGERLLRVLEAGLSAVDPEQAVERALSRTEEGIAVDGHHLSVAGRIHLVAFGKASPAMIRAAAGIAGDRIGRCLAISNHPEPAPAGVELMVASHPLPDERSEAAATAALALVGSVDAGDLVLFLVSGGGSALMETPSEGITLDEVREVGRLLLACGASIEHINAVRTQLSRVKGGRLAAATAGRYATLALSDVIGSRPDLIASGPTAPPLTSPADALQVLERFDLTVRIPAHVLDHLRAAEAPAGIGDAPYVVVGDGAIAAAACARAAEGLGLRPAIHSTTMQGEARRVAEDAHARVARGTLGIFAGETTVTLRGAGIGGRNQEGAVAMVRRIAGGPDRFLAFGTDGIDGPTDAAGALVDGDTLARGMVAGVDAAAALAENDAYRYLDATESLIRTGATGTNVGDLWLVDRTSG